MKNLLIGFFVFFLLIIITLVVIIMGYPVSKINHSSLSDEPNKNGLNFCMKEKRKYTRLLAMNLEMKDVYSFSEYQYYLKNTKNGDVLIIKNIPINVNVISICYFPKRQVWVGLATDVRGNDPIIDFKVIVITNDLHVVIKTIKTSHDFKHPIYNKYPEHRAFDIDIDSETIKYLSPEEKVELLDF